MRLPDDLVARLEGKSSLGRLGLLIHSTAGFVDAGWDGHLTLELSNVANLPITLYPGMRIGQISFLADDHAGRPPLRHRARLGSKYQGQRGPTPSRYFENFRRRGEDPRSPTSCERLCRDQRAPIGDARVKPPSATPDAEHQVGWHVARPDHQPPR